MDGPGHDSAARGVYRYGDPRPIRATYHGGTWLSLDQEPGSDQPGMAGETGTDCGMLAMLTVVGLLVYAVSAASAPLSPRA